MCSGKFPEGRRASWGIFSFTGMFGLNQTSELGPGWHLHVPEVSWDKECEEISLLHGGQEGKKQLVVEAPGCHPPENGFITKCPSPVTLKPHSLQQGEGKVASETQTQSPAPQPRESWRCREEKLGSKTGRWAKRV